MLSAEEQLQVVNQKIAKELDAHRLAGPFGTSPFPVFRVSRVGVVSIENSRRFLHDP